MGSFNDLQDNDSTVSIDLEYKVISGVLTITMATIFHQDENGEKWIEANGIRERSLFNEFAYKLLEEKLENTEVFYDSIAG